MGIEKDRRNRSGTGYKTTGAGSFGTIDVSSIATIAKPHGAAAWRGVTTIVSGDSTVVISASAATSGYPILLALGQTSVASHRDLVLSVSSLVDGISFLAEASGAVVDSQEICYTIIGG